MRIAIFTNAYKPIASGVVNMIDFLSNALRNKGHQVYIFAPDYDGYRDEDENVYRYKSVNLTRGIRFPIAIPFSFKVGKILVEFKPDIIHVHQPFVLGDAAYYYSRKFNIPLVFTLHTQYEMYSHYVPLPATIVKYFCRKIVKRFVEKADCVTIPAQSIALPPGQSYQQSWIEVIPNAIDIDAYLNISGDVINNIKARLGLENKKVILFVGRIALEKNLELLIDAFEQVQKRVTDARLLIVGDGTAFLQLKSHVHSKQLDDFIIFTGNIDYKSIPVFYKIAHVFAITSTTEVKPLVILEALAAHIPIVAVNAPGAMDTLTSGFDSILTREDVGEIADTIIRLLNDEIFYRQIKEGACFTASKYSIGVISNEFINLYKDILNKKAVGVSNKRALEIN